MEGEGEPYADAESKARGEARRDENRFCKNAHSSFALAFGMWKKNEHDGKQT